MLWFKDLYRAKEKYKSYRLGTILLCVSAEDPFSGYVLCSGEDPEPTGILDFFQTVKFPKFWDHGQKKQETEAKKDHE